MVDSKESSNLDLRLKEEDDNIEESENAKNDFICKIEGENPIIFNKTNSTNKTCFENHNINNSKTIKINWNNSNKNSFFSDIDSFFQIISFRIIPKGIGTIKNLSKQNILEGPPFILTFNETCFLYLK